MQFRGVVALVTLIVCCVLAAPVFASGNGPIAFVHDGDVWSVEPDGSAIVNLTNGRAGTVSGQITWSPDGSRLALASVAPMPELVIMRPDGTIETAIPETGSPVCWLSGGSVLVIRDVGTVDEKAQDLFVVDLQGQVVRRLTEDGGTKHLNAQSCARDGSKVVYAREGRDLHPRAFLVSASGGPPVQLTPPGLQDDLPTLSPSGDRVALARSILSAVAVTDLQGQFQTAASLYGVPGSAPLWSPDGQKLLYETSQVVYGPIHTEGRVHVAAADGTGERDLTSRLEPSRLRPQWSPDQARVAFLSNRSTSGNLWIANIDGTCPTAVGVAVNESFAWRPISGPTAMPMRCVNLETEGDFTTHSVGTGDPLAAVFRVSNEGNQTANAVMLRFSLQGPLEVDHFNTSGATCDVQTLVCTFGDLGPYESGSVGIAIKTAGPPDFSGSTVGPSRGLVFASATSGETDPDGTDNKASSSYDAYPCTQVYLDFGVTIRGTDGRDVLCGLGSSTLLGLGDSDTLVGGASADFLKGGPGRDLLLGRAGDDAILASDGEADKVDCGDGNDVAVADRLDQVTNCETVLYPRIRCETIPLNGMNTIVGTPNNDHLCGLDGNDTLKGTEGLDSIDGGPGNDTIDGGPGQDILFGNLGNDVIRARDGVSDVVDCGKGFDIAIIDRFDSVKHCERVLRKAPLVP